MELQLGHLYRPCIYLLKATKEALRHISSCESQTQKPIEVRSHPSSRILAPIYHVTVCDRWADHTATMKTAGKLPSDTESKT